MLRSTFALSLAVAIICASTAQAGQRHGHGHGKGHSYGHSHGKGHSHGYRKGKRKGRKNRRNKGRSAVISYQIDPATCDVSVSSTKDISNIVIKDSSGKLVKKWDDLSGKTFAGFGMYAVLLAEGTLHVKSGNNGVRGLGPDVGDQFRVELAACQISPPDCPVLAQIEEYFVNNPGAQTFQDFSNRCEVSSEDSRNYLILNNIGSDTFLPEALGKASLVRVLDFNTPDVCIDVADTPLPINATYTACPTGITDGGLTSEQAKSCAVEMGCSNF